MFNAIDMLTVSLHCKNRYCTSIWNFEGFFDILRGLRQLRVDIIGT